MNKNYKITLIFIGVIIAIFVIYLFWTNPRNKQIATLGDITFEGYLVTDCPWQAYPNLPKYDGCDLDIWLSKSEPFEQIPEICRNIDNTGQPITSSCFLKKIGYHVPERGKYPKATLIGNYEKIEVCYLSRKCIEPECSECSEENIFVPSKIIEK